jgi:hypothetical protein
VEMVQVRALPLHTAETVQVRALPRRTAEMGQVRALPRRTAEMGQIRALPRRTVGSEREHRRVVAEAINAPISAVVNATAEIEGLTATAAGHVDRAATRPTADVGAPNGGLPSPRPSKTPPPTSAPKRARSNP